MKQKQFLSILNNIPEIIYVADINTHKILFANKQLKETLGRDITGEVCFNAIQDKESPCEFCTNKYIKDTSEPYFWEYYNPILDRHFYIMDRKIKWTDKKEVRFELAIDITERIKAEEENKKLSVAIEQSPAMVVISDLLGNIEYVNPAFTKLSEYTKEEVIGKNPRILKSGKTKDEVYTQLWDTITSGKIWKGQFVNKTKRGEEYIEKATIAPIFNQQNEKTHYVAIKEDVTEKVKIENQIKASEEKYRLITENASDVIWILNLSKKAFTYISPSVFALRGFTPEEAMKQDLNQSLTPESAKEVTDTIEEILPQFLANPKEVAKNFYRNELRQTCKDGSVIWIETTTQYQFNANNEVEVLGISRNIEERKQAEEALKNSEEKYRLISENLSDVIWILNIAKQKLTYVSPSVLHTLGYTPDEVLKQDLDNLLTPGYIQKAKERILVTVDEFVKTQEDTHKNSYTFEAEARRKDGSRFWVEMKTSYSYNKNGEVELLGITRDIDQRKKHQDHLADRLHYEENLSLFSTTMFLNEPDVINKSLQYLLKAAKCSRVYIFENFIDEQNKLSMKQTFEVCAENIDPQINNPELEHVIYSEEGFMRWEKQLSENKIISGIVSTFPKEERDILEPQGIKSILVLPIFVYQKWFGFIGFDDTCNLRDWRIQDVDLLRTASETLGLFIENQKNKQTIEKQNAELREAIATKDKFFNIIAHDLKNPFNAILGFSDLLKNNIEEYDIALIKRIVGSINEVGDNTFKLLENLLEWSRSQQNKIPFNPQEIKLYDLTYDTYKLVNQVAGEKQISINLDVPQEISLEADLEMMKTIIRNIVINAIKYTKENGKINISGKQTHNNIILEISDTGIGMNEQTKKSLFKIDETQSQKGTNGEPGTGFGLLLCKEFVDKHKGTLNVESEVNKGSCFIITLPLKQNSH